jgi:tetratricopeptide (TPR) repeat protein
MAVEIFRNDQLTVRSVCEFGSDTCVVTFDSYSDDRSLDRRGFGEEFFHSRGIDAVHFISGENDWYQYADLPAVAAQVADLVKDYPRVVSYGSSMGAYAAIRFGDLAGASEALAISPQFSIDPRVARFERRWKYDSDRIDFTLERTLKARFIRTAYIVYDPRDADKRHADLFRRHTRVIDVSLPDVGHPATGSLAEAGLLGDVVLDFVADRLDPADLQRRIAASRETSPQFYYVKSSRAQFARSRIALAGRAADMAPGHFGFVANFASLLAESGRFEEAQIALARAAAIAPDHPVLLYKLTEFHERRGDLESAIEAAELLVSLHSETFRPRLNSLHALQQRRSNKRYRPTVTIRGKRIVGDPALPIDVRVTTTPSPPPFVESWRRHEQLLAHRPVEPVDVMLVGDSLVEYWPEEPWGALKVFNFGCKADKTQHAIWRLDQLPPGSVQAGHAIILIGTNNLGADDTATGIAAGVAAVVAATVRVAPAAKVLVVCPPPCGPDFRFRNAVRRKAIKALSGLGGYATIDPDAVLTADPDQASRNYHEDRIHLSEAGYRVLTELVKRDLG